jgi:SAM-dependent methyltransferase
MADRDWNAHYADDFLPWDEGRPDNNLMDAVAGGAIAAGRALEIGCGTGTNAVWLAEQGFEVVAVDIAPLAIERAQARAGGSNAADRCSFEVIDFLAQDPPSRPFQFVFDRGCFHVFDQAEVRARFATRVAELLVPGGLWLSLLGSTEGPPRDMGPPRRSARDIASAIEPALEIVELRGIEFDLDRETRPRAWSCLSRRRSVPAQPSTMVTGDSR